MPFDAAAQLERDALSVLARCPAFREVRKNIIEPVLRLGGIKYDEIVENAHHWHRRREGRFLIDRHAGGAVAVINPQSAALLLSMCDASCRCQYDQPSD